MPDMEIKQVLPDPVLYRATLPDDEGIIQKRPRKARTALGDEEISLGDSDATDEELTATGRFRAPQGQAAGQVGSEEKETV